MIYLDHNATTPVAGRVFEAMAPFLSEFWGNPSSPYRFGNRARVAVEGARARIASMLGYQASEVFFCSSGTEADNWALRGVTRALRGKGRHIVTSAIEHHAVLHTCKDLEDAGYQVSYVPVSANGVVDVELLERSWRSDTVLVSVMHANSETGVIQPVEEIAAIARRRGVVMHIDAVQSVGKLPFELAGLGADLVSLSAHKLYGPKGAAALCVRKGTPLAPLITGGGQEQGLRAGTENVAAIVGFAEALALSLEGMEAEARRQTCLRDRLERALLSEIHGVRVNGAGTARVPNTSSLSFQDIDGESVVLGLDVRGVCVSTGSACSTGEPEPSHVLRAMRLTPQQAQGTVRVSLGRETSDHDIDTAQRAFRETVARLRQISSVGGSAPVDPARST